MRRRTYIAVAGSGILALAGCTGARRSANDGPGTADSGGGRPPQWTRSTGCDGMQDSVITVEWTTSSVDGEYAPIPYTDLTEGERTILEAVVREGGYGTCEVTEAFRRFVERVGEHRERQEADVVCLEYEGRYYGLYVEQQDMVFSMG